MCLKVHRAMCGRANECACANMTECVNTKDPPRGRPGEAKVPPGRPRERPSDHKRLQDHPQMPPREPGNVNLRTSAERGDAESDPAPTRGYKTTPRDLPESPGDPSNAAQESPKYPQADPESDPAPTRGSKTTPRGLPGGPGR